MRTILASTPADVLILSACSCAALNSPVRYSRMDSDWVSMFVSFISRKKHCSESDPEDIVSLCLYRYRPWCEQAFSVGKFDKTSK